MDITEVLWNEREAATFFVLGIQAVARSFLAVKTAWLPLNPAELSVLAYHLPEQGKRICDSNKSRKNNNTKQWKSNN